MRPCASTIVVCFFCVQSLGHSKLICCFSADRPTILIDQAEKIKNCIIRNIRAIIRIITVQTTWKVLMATGSDFAWPSVTVKQSSTVLKGRSIVKCNWSDKFATLLEKAGREFSTEVVIQVIISKSERLDTTHTVLLDAPVKLLETYGCLHVCYYLTDNTAREPAQGVEMP